MATVTAFIRTSQDDKNKTANVRFRLRDGRKGIDKTTGKEYNGIQLFHKSELTVIPEKWDVKQQKIKARCIFNDTERKIFDDAVSDRKRLINNIYVAQGKTLTSERLDAEIDKALHPERYKTKEQTFFEAFDEFLAKRKISAGRVRAFKVIVRALKRYEMYVRAAKWPRFVLSFETVTQPILHDIEEFLCDEHLFAEKYPSIYEAIPECRPPKPRGQNTINGILSKIRTLFIWANDAEKTNNNPFKNFEIQECVYGTPYYISIDERNKLYNTDLSHRPALEIQRDIFVFQCLIGCRVSDLYKLTRQNVINGAIEYIANKTKDDRPVTVRVPFNAISKKILAKYADFNGKTLLPYIASQEYNEAIKEMFTIAKITRSVVILDPLTRESVVRQLNLIASSHLARRCFIGNMYKKVKDPNQVGALSGHREGSRAFARYREIDEEMKQELVNMLE